MKCALERFADGHNVHGLNKIVQSLSNPDIVVDALSQLGFNPNGLAKLFGEQEPQVKCPKCGSTWRDLSRTKQLGCEECFATFHDKIANLLNPINRAIWNTYESKFPHADDVPDSEAEDIEDAVKQRDLKFEIERLKRELACAVKNEDYERAARLRDLIAEFNPTPITEQSE